jgi:hypothetical protein
MLEIGRRGLRLAALLVLSPQRGSAGAGRYNHYATRFVKLIETAARTTVG